MQLEGEDKEVKDKVTLFMIVAVLQTNIFVFLSVLLVLADQDLNLFPSSQEAVGMVDRCSQECFMDTPSNHPKCKV